MDALTLRRIKGLVEENKEKWMADFGAQDITVGVKEVAGEITKKPCIKFWMGEKIPYKMLDPKYRIPHQLEGIATDVVTEETYEVYNVGTGKMRPIIMGASAGSKDHTGTTGFLYRIVDKYYLLGNSHVWAMDCFKSLSEQEDRGIYQPGPYHQTTNNATLCGELTHMLQLNDWNETQTPNNKECALALLVHTGAKPEQINLKGPLVPECTLMPGDEVIYSTWQMDGVTEGVVTDVGKAALVNHPPTKRHPKGRQVMFVDQIVLSKCSGPGSSGSGVMRKYDLAAGGLNHAGSATRNIVCSIHHINAGYGGEVVCVSGSSGGGIREMVCDGLQWIHREIFRCED